MCWRFFTQNMQSLSCICVIAHAVGRVKMSNRYRFVGGFKIIFHFLYQTFKIFLLPLRVPGSQLSASIENAILNVLFSTIVIWEKTDFLGLISGCFFFYIAHYEVRNYFHGYISQKYPSITFDLRKKEQFSRMSYQIILMIILIHRLEKNPLNHSLHTQILVMQKEQKPNEMLQEKLLTYIFVS